MPNSDVREDTHTARFPAPLEVWGGVECTLNRVGDLAFDQLAWSGHAERDEDLERFADLGIRAMRYPVSWERVTPLRGDQPMWDWTDRRLARLRELGVRPIAGLVHHGSGPHDTHLLDPEWPERLAGFAAAAARRYPWILDWTPVNEPLTTARFSGLYGVWHPHGRDALTFARVLLTQCRGVALAMRAVREVTPEARLVQTEDLAKTHSTPGLRYQAEFENERRWLTFDLLCGRVTPEHPLAQWLRWVGVEERDVAWFLEAPCAPDLLGLNHYVTSERFLDERLGRYPADSHGGNDRQRYADVEAVRVRVEGSEGPLTLLREAWERYRLPLAVTEAHLGCTREEQMRWLAELWDAAQSLRAEGADVRAVTAWSLLGAFDWASLVTSGGGSYEPGAFDLRAPRPRATALARVVRDLAREGRCEHPVLSQPGWWRRPERLIYPPVVCGGGARRPVIETRAATREPARPVAVTGSGALMAAVLRSCAARGLRSVVLEIHDDSWRGAEALAGTGAWAMVHAEDPPDGEAAAEDPRVGARLAHRMASVARACAARGTPLLAFSSARVFGAARAAAPVEEDLPSPRTRLARAYVRGERALLQGPAPALVVRAGDLFGGGAADTLGEALRALALGRRHMAAADVAVTPTYLPDLVNAALDLLIDGERGLWHLAGEVTLTPAELARRAAEVAGLDGTLVESRPAWALGLGTSTRRSGALASRRGRLLPPFGDALRRRVAEEPGGSALDPVTAGSGTAR
ncbi:MAG: family 1 glycosylhydrolase [Gemmatimonadota bacterium]